MGDYESVCARLSSTSVGAVAASEGIVWGQIKGYPFWPAQVVPTERANKDAVLRDARSSKGGVHTALQFFGDTTKAWVKEDALMPWADGCAKGFLKGKGKGKMQAVYQAHDFLQTGTLPDGWWLKSLREPPMKRAAAAAASAPAKQQQQRVSSKQKAALPAAPPAEQQQQPAVKKQRSSKAAAGSGTLTPAPVEAAVSAPAAAPSSEAEQSVQQVAPAMLMAATAAPAAAAVVEEAAVSMEADPPSAAAPLAAAATEAAVEEPPVAGAAATVAAVEEPPAAAAAAAAVEEPPAAAAAAAAVEIPPAAAAAAAAAVEDAPAAAAAVVDPPAAAAAVVDPPAAAATAAAAPDPSTIPATAAPTAPAVQAPAAAALAPSTTPAAASGATPPVLNALPAWAAAPVGPAAAPAGAVAAAARALHPHAAPTAGSGSTSTRDMLRSVFNRIKLLHPVAARLETPNSVSDLLGALARHFGPAMALSTDQLRGKDANDVLAGLFSWARGRAVSPAEVERCFPLVPHGKVLMPYVLWDRISELGLYPLHWQLPLIADQVQAAQRDGAAGLPAPHSAPACRVAAPGSATAAASSSISRKKPRALSMAGSTEPRAHSEPRAPRAAPRRQQTHDLDADYEPVARAARRPSAPAALSRFAVESSAGAANGSGSGVLQLESAVEERAPSPSLTAEEQASSQRALAAGRGPGLPVVDGRIVKPKPGSGWPGPAPEGFEDGPPVLEGKNSLPSYVHIRQNVWVSRPRPKRLNRDDIPVCNCHAPVGLSISSRRAALEQQQAQQAALRLQQQQAAAASAALAAQQHQQQQQQQHPQPYAAFAAASGVPPLPAPPPHAAAPAVQPAVQHANGGGAAAAAAAVPPAAHAQQAASPEGVSAAASAAGGGSAKKRVRRTDWEGRKCDWCGVTETSNWRRHPDNREMLLCNQCGGYVRKHGKLSEERRERVAAQQVAAAIASVASLAAPPLGPAAGGPLPLFQPAGAVLPPLPPPPMPLPESQKQQQEAAVVPPAFTAAQLQQQFGVQQQQEQESAVAAAMATVGAIAAGMRDSASPPGGPQQSAPAEAAAGPAAMEVDASVTAAGEPPVADAVTDMMQVDEPAGAGQAASNAEAAAAVAALVAAVFAPWQEELAALREEQQAVAGVVAAVFAPHLPQQPQAPEQPQPEPRVDPQLQPQHAAAVPAPAVFKQEPEAPAHTQQQQPAVQVKQQPGTEVKQQGVQLPLPAIKLQRPSAAALAAVQAAPTRSSSGLRRAAASAAASAAAPQVGCGDSCLNRLSFIHCDRSTCPCGDRCTNRPFVELSSPSMEVYLTPDKGWGVRAAAFIPRGTFIVEYAGEVVDDKECNRRAEEAKARNEPHFYMMEMAPGLIIDARSKGNLARLLNSSCDPNCETQKWHDAGNSEVRVGIFSLRDILPGEELTYDYQFQHFGLAAAAGAYRCKCGAPNCRGTMDTQPERMRDFGRRLDVWWPAEKRYFRGTITGYSSSQQRHTVKYDDGDVGRVYLPAEKYRWVDEYGHVVGDTHEPEPNASRSGAGAGTGGSRKRGGGSDSNGGGGGKRHKRSTVELLGAGGRESSGSDLQSLPSGPLPSGPLPPVQQPLAAAAAPAPASAQGPALAAGALRSGVEETPVPMDAAGPAAATEPALLHQQPGTAGMGVGLLSAQAAGPASKVMDAYDPFNLVSQPPWGLPPVSVGSLAPPPQLDIVGLRVNSKLSSLLPPPAQAGPLPEALPLDTTSPLAGSATAPGAFNPFNNPFGAGSMATLDGLTSQQQQMLSACGISFPMQQAQKLPAAPASVAVEAVLPTAPAPLSVAHAAEAPPAGLLSLEAVQPLAATAAGAVPVLAAVAAAPAAARPEPMPSVVEPVPAAVKPVLAAAVPMPAAVEPAAAAPMPAAVQLATAKPVPAAAGPVPSAAGSVPSAVQPAAAGPVPSAVQPAAAEPMPAAVEPAAAEPMPAAVEPAAAEPMPAAVKPAAAEPMPAAVEPAAAKPMPAAAEPAALVDAAPAVPALTEEAMALSAQAAALLAEPAPAPQPSMWPALGEGQAAAPQPMVVCEPVGLAIDGLQPSTVKLEHEELQPALGFTEPAAAALVQAGAALPVQPLPLAPQALLANVPQPQQVGAQPEVRQLRDPSLQPISGTIGHRRGRGGGQPGLADAEPSRPRRTVRRPARRFDEDYEAAEPDSDEDYVPSEQEEPASPPRASVSHRARAAAAASLSPTTQAAFTMASLLGAGGLPVVRPAVVGRPAKREEDDDPDATLEGLSTRSTRRQAPAGRAAPTPVHVPATAPAGAPRAAVGGNRRNAPTPASTGLPARTILVAKRLTNSDVSKGRILLPRAAVEANLSFAIGKAHSLIARDHQQQTWEFTLQSWANGSRAGMESRRVYVLEHAGDFVRAHALKPDDVIGLSSADDGTFLVEYNTEEVLAASENLAGARFGQPAPMPAAGSVRPAANMLIQQNAGRCMRSEHCTKPAGHPGFCVRTHAAAAAAAARKARQANAAAAAAAAAAAHSPPLVASPLAAAAGGGPSSDEGITPGSGRLGLGSLASDLAGVKRVVDTSLFDDDSDVRPKRARKPTEKANAMDEDEDSDDDYLAQAARTADAMAEAAADSDAIATDDDSEPPLMHPTFFQLKARPPAAASGKFPPPPPVPPANVPPIFVMAPDPGAPAATHPQQLRSPLRPSLSLKAMHSSGSLPLPHPHGHAGPLHLPPASLPLTSSASVPIPSPTSLPQAMPLTMPGSGVLPATTGPHLPPPPMPTPLGLGSGLPPPPGQHHHHHHTPGSSSMDVSHFLVGSSPEQYYQQHMVPLEALHEQRQEQPPQQQEQQQQQQEQASAPAAPDTAEQQAAAPSAATSEQQEPAQGQGQPPAAAAASEQTQPQAAAQQTLAPAAQPEQQQPAGVPTGQQQQPGTSLQQHQQQLGAPPQQQPQQPPSVQPQQQQQLLPSGPPAQQQPQQQAGMPPPQQQQQQQPGAPKPLPMPLPMGLPIPGRPHMRPMPFPRPMMMLPGGRPAGPLPGGAMPPRMPLPLPMPGGLLRPGSLSRPMGGPPGAMPRPMGMPPHGALPRPAGMPPGNLARPGGAMPLRPGGMPLVGLPRPAGAPAPRPAAALPGGMPRPAATLPSSMPRPAAPLPNSMPRPAGTPPPAPSKSPSPGPAAPPPAGVPPGQTLAPPPPLTGVPGSAPLLPPRSQPSGPPPPLFGGAPPAMAPGVSMPHPMPLHHHISMPLPPPPQPLQPDFDVSAFLASAE